MKKNKPFVRPASEEAKDWFGVRRSPNDEWRCQHRRMDDRLCNRLLAVYDDGAVYSKRGDYEAVMVDFYGSATAIRCTECRRWNWILSDQLTCADIRALHDRTLPSGRT